jgi:hypothetical protein
MVCLLFVKHPMVYIKIDECSFTWTTLLRRICPYIEITIEILGKNNLESFTPRVVGFSQRLTRNMIKTPGSFAFTSLSGVNK